jgi:hypothetical protein
MPMSGKSEFIKKDIHITKVRLKPTDNNSVSTAPKRCSFRRRRMMKPGIKVRKIKPTVCLKTGISNPRAANATKTNRAS